MVAPLITVAVAGWTVVLRLLLLLRAGAGKGKAVNSTRLPATVYTPEPHNWDTPLPIWAVSPPRTVWDPLYLQQHDPSQARSVLSSSEHQDTLSLSSKYAGDRVSVLSVGEEEDEEEEQSRHTVEVVSPLSKHEHMLTIHFIFSAHSGEHKEFRYPGNEMRVNGVPCKGCHMS